MLIHSDHYLAMEKLIIRLYVRWINVKRNEITVQRDWQKERFWENAFIIHNKNYKNLIQIQIMILKSNRTDIEQIPASES